MVGVVVFVIGDVGGIILKLRHFLWSSLTAPIVDTKYNKRGEKRGGQGGIIEVDSPRKIESRYKDKRTN